MDGFPPGILVGTKHINDIISNQAKLDLTAAYNDAAGRTSTDIVTLSGNIGGLTLTPGLYKSTSSLEISSGDLTFDAQEYASTQQQTDTIPDLVLQLENVCAQACKELE